MGRDGKGVAGAIGARARACLGPWAGWAALVLLVPLAACVPAQSDVRQVPVGPEVIKSSVRFQKEYLLVAGDQIEVSVWRVPEVSRSVIVRPDGFVSLPLLQEVKAAGLTPRELAESIRDRLSGRLINPEVTVIPQQVRQPTIYVLGDVRAPGAYPARNATTAVQALALAGGALRTASEQDVTIIRLSGDGYLEAIPVSSASDSQPGPLLTLAATMVRADDIVFVPESGRSQIVRLLNELLLPVQIFLDYKLIESLI